MAYKSLMASNHVAAYVNDDMVQETELQRRLRAETASLPLGIMQISADQGAFLAFLIKLIGARRALEIGTFTGYSALCVAAALPDDGRLVACDVSEEWTAIAQRYWREAGVDRKIDLRLAPALETIQNMIDDGQAGTFDFAFIDADKTNNQRYYEAALVLVRSGGLIAIDNALPNGLADGSVDSEAGQMAMALNLNLRDDPRIDFTLVTVGAGMVLAHKR